MMAFWDDRDFNSTITEVELLLLLSETTHLELVSLLCKILCASCRVSVI